MVKPLNLATLLLVLASGIFILPISLPGIVQPVQAQTETDRKTEADRLLEQGNQQFDHSQYREALQSWQKALAIYREIGDLYGEGAVIDGVGRAYSSLGDYTKAIEYYQQALAIARKIGTRQGEARSLNNLGIAYDSLGQYAKAINFYQQSLVIFQDIGDRQGESSALGNLGNAYYSLGQYAKAIDFYQQSLVIFQDIGDRKGEGVTFSNIGILLEKQNQPELAIIFYKQSVNVRESIRENLRTLPREQQESYTQTVAGTYRSLANLLLSQGRVLEAQQALELLKTQELRDYTRDTRAGGKTKGSPLTPPEARVVPPYDSMIALGLKLTQCEQKPPYCPERDQLRSQKDAAVAAFNQQVDQLRKLAKQQDRDPAQLQNEELTVAAQKIVQSQPQTVLIYPLVLEDKLWLVWGVQGGKQGVIFDSKSIPVGRKELAATVVEFRQLLGQPGNLEQLQQVSHKLYQWLIEPLRPELDKNGIKHLVFSLDRSTRYIPMAALFDGKDYLIQNFTVSTILTAGLTDTQDKLSSNLEEDPVLGLGLSESFTNDFKALPHVKDEINGIVRTPENPKGIYPGLSLFNGDFTRKAFNNIIDHRILHIATHGQFVSSNPEESFLLLGDGEHFTITEIKTMTDLSGINLVVLSACETAKGGADQDGIEVSGLSYYFIASGAKSVIASLWLVNDASTSQLMQQFYQNLATGKMTKSEALRQAQLALIQGNGSISEEERGIFSMEVGDTERRGTDAAREFSHPYYWAPFILIGNAW